MLERFRDLYDEYSHPTQLTLANLISFSESSKLYLGATFDKGKLEQYAKEINGRVSLAMVFDNFIDGVKANVKKW